jgi:hypothetical protein
MHFLSRLSIAAAAVFSIAGAHADTLYTLGAPTAALVTPSSVSASFSAAAGAGTVDLQLAGYNTLDGDNDFIDIFSITLNGSEVFAGTWDLGGGGINRILSGPSGATATATYFGYGLGGTVDISLPVTLLGGSNALVFAYASPTTFELTGRAGPQGLGDEGWGLNSVTVTGAVPEPGTYALMAAGLVLLGASVRRTRRG